MFRKRNLLLSGLVVLAMQALNLGAAPCGVQPTCCEPCCPERDGFLQGKVGYFYPFSSSLREVIGETVDYQISFSYRAWESLFVFTSLDFLTTDGHSTGDHSDVDFWLLPFTLGLKVLAPVYQSDDCVQEVDLYFAIAPRYYWSHATNHSHYVDHHNFAHGFGGMAGVGAIYSYQHWSVEAFLDASYAKIHSHAHKHNVVAPHVQVGSLVAGGSIGYNF